MFLKTSDDVQVFYKFKKFNEGITLVFIHGWNNNWTCWNEEIKYFQKKGCNTLTLDLRGNGKSDDSYDKDYSIARLAKDIKEIKEKEDIGNIILVGFSLGGMISLDYYKQFSKEVKGLILINSTYKNVLSMKRIKFLSYYVSKLIGKVKPYLKIKKYNLTNDQSKYKGKPDIWYLYDGLKNTSVLTLLSYLDDLITYDGEVVLKKIKVPTLIIHGEKDMVLEKHHSLELHNKIKQSTLKTIRNGEHAVIVDSPDKINKIIEDFLKKNNLI